MKKFLLLILLLANMSMADLINAIAFTVNNQPITLYEIDRLSQQQKISKQQAIIELFKQAITREVAAEKNIVITKESVKMYISSVIKQNHFNEKSFKQNLKIEGMTYEEYSHEVYMQLLKQRLISVLISGKIEDPTKIEKENFFNQNINSFSIPKNIEVTQYTTQNRQSLINIKRSPMFTPKDVKQTKRVLDIKKVDPKVAKLLLQTGINNFSKIIPTSSNSYSMFYINKLGKIIVPKFAMVEKELTQLLIRKKSNTFINNFFQDKMRKANVNYIMIKPIQF